MKRFAFVVGVLVVAAGTGLVWSPSGARAQKDPSIKEIMARAHKGRNSLLTTLDRELKSDTPEWSDIQKHAKELVSLGTSLGKNAPPKGDKSSWQQLTKQYTDNAVVLVAAAQKRDKIAAQAGQKKLADSCKACHAAHQGK